MPFFRRPPVNSSYNTFSYLLAYYALFLFLPITKGASGPFEVIVHGTVPCEDVTTNGQVAFNNAKVQRYNRTAHTLSFDLENTVPLDDTLFIKAMVNIWGNGGWRPTTTLEIPNGCNFIYNNVPLAKEHMFRRILNLTGCPIPPGSYKVYDIPLSTFSIHTAVPSFEYGKYKDYFVIQNAEEEAAGCLGFILDAIPRKRRKG